MLSALQSYELMRLPPREATAEGDLSVPFQQSALKSTADQDPFFQHLKIRYVKASDAADQLQVCQTSYLFLTLLQSQMSYVKCAE